MRTLSGRAPGCSTALAPCTTLGETQTRNRRLPLEDLLPILQGKGSRVFTLIALKNCMPLHLLENVRSLYPNFFGSNAGYPVRLMNCVLRKVVAVLQCLLPGSDLRLLRDYDLVNGRLLPGIRKMALFFWLGL